MKIVIIIIVKHLQMNKELNSDPTDKINECFQAIFMSVLRHGCTTWTSVKCLDKKLD